MAGLMERLVGVLTDQLSNYDALIGLSEIKKDVIVSNDAESLQKITSEENAVVGRVQKLDKSRVSIMADIADVMDIREADYTLTDLCELIKEQDEYETLCGIVKSTREKLEELKAINTKNKELVENSLDYIDFSMNVMRSSIVPEKRFYNTSGDEIAPGSGFFDARQ